MGTSQTKSCLPLRLPKQELPPSLSWITWTLQLHGEQQNNNRKPSQNNKTIMCSRVFPRATLWQILEGLFLTGILFILYSKAKLACYSRDVLTSYFYIPVPYDEKDTFFCWKFRRSFRLPLNCSASLALVFGAWKVKASQLSSVQFSCSVCPTLRPRECSTPGLPIHHQLLEFIQTHVHWVGDAIQPSHPPSSSSPPALNLSQKATQLCPTLCNPMDYTVQGILRPEYWSL